MVEVLMPDFLRANSIELMSRVNDIYLNNVRHGDNVNVLPDDILTKEKLEDIMLHDIYWNYDTCKRYGLVDDVYTNYNERDVADSIHFLHKDLKEISSMSQHNSINLEECRPSDKIINRITEFAKTQENILDVIKKHMEKGHNIEETNNSELEDSSQTCSKRKRPSRSKKTKSSNIDDNNFSDMLDAQVSHERKLRPKRNKYSSE
jgi:predicted small metal-binding protein